MTHNYYANREDDDGEGWTQQEARNTPVDAEQCIWCKTPKDEASTEYVDLSTHESICQVCLKDLREWKRYLYVQFYVSSGLTPAVERILHDYGSSVTAELEQHYSSDDTVQRISKQFTNAVRKETDYEPPRTSRERDR